ncbi:MAG: tRNA1(Val) (adenine(37)-N6)-methyltransferase [Clostridia bacterium]|nr:tRNA1(Val) (adenine(37)-N6)-methyltransferase [Clostridia bacterium]
MDLRLDDLGVENLKIWQDKDLFCFGTDAVLLANFACPKSKDKLLDIGTGNGIIPLLLTAKSDVSHITGLEIQSKSFALAKKNVEFNNLTHKIEIIEGDIKDTALFSAASFSYITCNPPYKPVGTGLKNPDSPLALARHEILCTLEDIISRAAFLLCSKGKLAMVHKPERAAQIIYLMKKNRIEPKRMLTVHARTGQAPCLILIEGMKDGNEGLKWEDPLTIYDENGVYTAHCNMLYQKTKEKKA